MFNDTKTCACCKRQLHISEFHKQTGKAGGIRSHCKECRRADHLCNRETRIKRFREIYWRDHEKTRAKAAITSKKWRLAHRDKVRFAKVIYMARRRAAEGSFTSQDIAEIAAAQKQKCAICRISIKTTRHIDHIIPIAKGGTNCKSNLQLLCRLCNQAKWARDPIDYMRSIGWLL